jgi:hypothetical protein
MPARAGIEHLESRQLLSATLVEITIPVSTGSGKHVEKHPTKPSKITKPTKPAKTANTGSSGHAIIGYESFT